MPDCYQSCLICCNSLILAGSQDALRKGLKSALHVVHAALEGLSLNHSGEKLLKQIQHDVTFQRARLCSSRFMTLFVVVKKEARGKIATDKYRWN